MDKNSKKVYNNITEAVGQTPMVKLNNFCKEMGIKCQIYGKCEYLNVGGSIKDRISINMLNKAEEEGIIKKGDTLIEATSGNTGIGISMAGAAKGYKVKITMPEKMSKEKANTMKILGAEIIRTRNSAKFDDYDSHIEIGKRMQKEIPNSHILDQYKNKNNYLAHYNYTGAEIMDQMDNKFDYLFAGAGTGGTISGISMKIKELNKDIKVVAIDPYASIMAVPKELNETDINFYEVEGIGYDFIPDVCKMDFIDSWVKTEDKESFDMARKIIKTEGILCGGSSGAVMAGCIKYLKEHNLIDNENIKIVVVFPDSVRNYLFKFIDDDWMIKKKFLSNELFLNEKSKLYKKNITEFKDVLQKLPYYDSRMTVRDCLDNFNKGNLVLTIFEKGEIKGIINREELINKIINKNLEGNSSCMDSISEDYILLEENTDMSIVEQMITKFNRIFIKIGEDLFLLTSNELIKIYSELMKLTL